MSTLVTFAVAGVSYPNPDGKSRQGIIRNLEEGDAARMQGRAGQPLRPRRDRRLDGRRTCPRANRVRAR